MADINLMPARGVPFMARVDANGIAFGGTSTLLQLAQRGMRAVCVVGPDGLNGAVTVAQLASAGIRAVCLVDENGNSGAPIATADTLRSRGIKPLVPLTAAGLNGTTTMLQLAQRGLGYACLVDETGTAI
jgi:DNA-binding transcriptional LysR family regulator